MKPPKITPGKWLNDSEVIYDEHGAIIAEIPCPVISARGRDADTVKAEMQEIRCANMDALSALPECLAALHSQYLRAVMYAEDARASAHDISQPDRSDEAERFERNAAEIRAALLKAGYTEE
jgi:hypothetical protein